MIPIAKKPDKIRLFCSGIFFVHLRWWRCGDLHSGLERFDKTFYILIRRLNLETVTVVGDLERFPFR